MYTRHMGSRLYTLDLDVITTVIEHMVHCVTKACVLVQKMSVPEHDSLLHICARSKSLANQLFLKG
jgi:hypothetical protein